MWIQDESDGIAERIDQRGNLNAVAHISDVILEFRAERHHAQRLGANIVHAQ